VGLAFLWVAFAQPALAMDTDAVVSSLCDADVVALGELPSHGEAAVQEMRASITHELIEQCGFQRVLFESAAIEFFSLEKDAMTRANSDNALGGFLSSDNLAPFRAWLFDKVTAGKVSVSGIDDQIGASSQFSRTFLPALIARASGQPECGRAVERNLFWRYGDAAPYDVSEQFLLFSCLASIRGDTLSPEESFAVEVLLRLYARQAGIEAFGTRDASMATIALWHLEKDRALKTIIWSANTHIAEATGPSGITPMGQRLATELGDHYRSVAFTVLDGETARMGASPSALEALPPHSLEQGAARDASGALSYIYDDRLRQQDGSPSRLMGGVKEADWSRMFDGVVVLPETCPPSYSR